MSNISPSTPTPNLQGRKWGWIAPKPRFGKRSKEEEEESKYPSIQKQQFPPQPPSLFPYISDSGNVTHPQFPKKKELLRICRRRPPPPPPLTSHIKENKKKRKKNKAAGGGSHSIHRQCTNERNRSIRKIPPTHSTHSHISKKKKKYRDYYYFEIAAERENRVREWRINFRSRPRVATAFVFLLPLWNHLKKRAVQNTITGGKEIMFVPFCQLLRNRACKFDPSSPYSLEDRESRKKGRFFFFKNSWLTREKKKGKLGRPWQAQGTSCQEKKSLLASGKESWKKKSIETGAKGALSKSYLKRDSPPPLLFSRREFFFSSSDAPRFSENAENEIDRAGRGEEKSQFWHHGGGKVSRLLLPSDEGRGGEGERNMKSNFEGKERSLCKQFPMHILPLTWTYLAKVAEWRNAGFEVKTQKTSKNTVFVLRRLKNPPLWSILLGFCMIPPHVRIRTYTESCQQRFTLALKAPPTSPQQQCCTLPCTTTYSVFPSLPNPAHALLAHTFRCIKCIKCGYGAL